MIILVLSLFFPLNVYAQAPFDDSTPTLNIGAKTYQQHCSLCHGVAGEGDGHLARVINNPLPANLTKSTAADEYLLSIVTQGGEAMGRSPKMPPWGNELSESEIKSLVIHINSLRK